MLYSFNINYLHTSPCQAVSCGPGLSAIPRFCSTPLRRLSAGHRGGPLRKI